MKIIKKILDFFKGPEEVQVQEVRGERGVQATSIQADGDIKIRSISASASGPGTRAIATSNGGTAISGSGGARIEVDGKVYEAPPGKSLKVIGDKVYIDGELQG